MKERAGAGAAAPAGGADRASLRIRKLGQRLVAARRRQGRVMKFMSANDRLRRSDRTVCAKPCLPVAEMQLALGETRGMSEQAGHRMTHAPRGFHPFPEHPVAPA